MQKHTHCGDDVSSGIYEIVNLINGKRYIGSAKNLVRRSCEHRSQLRRGVHSNKHLQSSANKYGFESLVFKAILICHPEDLIDYEQRCIDILNPEYNKDRVAGSRLGSSHSDDSKIKMRIAKLGKKMDESARLRMSGRLKGHPVSVETRLKISKKLMGHTVSDAVKLHAANLGRSQKGKIFSVEHRAKLSLFAKSRPKEYYEKICASMREKKVKKNGL